MPTTSRTLTRSVPSSREALLTRQSAPPVGVRSAAQAIAAYPPAQDLGDVIQLVCPPRSITFTPPKSSAGEDVGPDGTADRERDELDDGPLVALLRGGDMQALGTLFARHHRCLLATARRLVDPTTAEDLVSEAIVRLIAAIRRGHGPDSNVCGYLQRTVRNCAVDHLRRQRALPEQRLEERAADIDPTEQTIRQVQFRRALARLPRRWQDVLWMSYGLGLSRDELSESLNLSHQAAIQLLYRARSGLRATLAQEGVGQERERPSELASRCVTELGA